VFSVKNCEFNGVRVRHMKLANWKSLGSNAALYRGVGPACRRHDAVQSQINDHLAVVISIVPDDHACSAEPRVRRAVISFEGIKLFLRGDARNRCRAHSRKRSPGQQQSSQRAGHQSSQQADCVHGVGTEHAWEKLGITVSQVIKKVTAGTATIELHRHRECHHAHSSIKAVDRARRSVVRRLRL